LKVGHVARCGSSKGEEACAKNSENDRSPSHCRLGLHRPFRGKPDTARRYGGGRLGGLASRSWPWRRVAPQIGSTGTSIACLCRGPRAPAKETFSLALGTPRPVSAARRVLLSRPSRFAYVPVLSEPDAVNVALLARDIKGCSAFGRCGVEVISGFSRGFGGLGDDRLLPGMKSIVSGLVLRLADFAARLRKLHVRTRRGVAPDWGARQRYCPVICTF
jgi:hypothetical protein